MEDKPEFVGEIEERTKTNFKVTGIPIITLKEFKAYCLDECGDVYHVGIRQLLMTKQKYDDLIPTLSHLQKQIDDLNKKLDTPKKKTIKTMGGELEVGKDE